MPGAGLAVSDSGHPRPFDRYLGIDYSGAKTPESRLKALQVYAGGPRGEVKKVLPPASASKSVHWSRQDIARWIVELTQSGVRFLAGIDHCFSLPLSYFWRYGLLSWDAFLEDFIAHWPAHATGISIEALLKDPPDRLGQPGELRLTERWTQAAKSVFVFQGAGSVGKASFAGIPWLHFIRKQAGETIHFWPYDGWDLPEGKSVIVEAYPALCKRRYPREGRTPDEHDAYSLAAWLRDMDGRGVLHRYSRPPLTQAEEEVALLEGWIFGVG